MAAATTDVGHGEHCKQQHHSVGACTTDVAADTTDVGADTTATVATGTAGVGAATPARDFACSDEASEALRGL